MFSFSSKQTQESAACPGVRFTVRRLNDIQRARRNLKLIEARAHLTELSARFEDAGNGGADLVSPEQMRADHEIGLAINIDMKPAYIRAGLISIEGLEIDGAAATVDTLIEFGPTDLVNEVYGACALASGLTADQSKNSPSPGTSAVPEAGPESSTIASVAGE